MKLFNNKNRKFYQRYSSEEREAIVLIQNVIGAYPFDNEWNTVATTLGMVFCDDDNASLKKGRLNWLVSEEERNSEKGWSRFFSGQICRVKVRRLLDEYALQNMTPDDFNSWCVTEIMEPSAECAELQAVWDEYSSPETLEDEILGMLTLNKEFDILEGYFTWKGVEVSLMIEVDGEDRESWETVCDAARRMLLEMEKWDSDMRAFAAEKLTSLANEWQDNDEDNEVAHITEESFAERIALTELTFSFEDFFTAQYHDDNMFWGHAVEVDGTIENGTECANIVG